jgi:hypothetical protein
MGSTSFDAPPHTIQAGPDCQRQFISLLLQITLYAVHGPDPPRFTIRQPAGNLNCLHPNCSAHRIIVSVDFGRTRFFASKLTAGSALRSKRVIPDIRIAIFMVDLPQAKPPVDRYSLDLNQIWK